MRSEPSQTIAALLIENLFTRYDPETHVVNGHWTCLCNSYILFLNFLLFTGSRTWKLERWKCWIEISCTLSIYHHQRPRVRQKHRIIILLTLQNYYFTRSRIQHFMKIRRAISIPIRNKVFKIHFVILCNFKKIENNMFLL